MIGVYEQKIKKISTELEGYIKSLRLSPPSRLPAFFQFGFSSEQKLITATLLHSNLNNYLSNINENSRDKPDLNTFLLSVIPPDQLQVLKSGKLGDFYRSLLSPNLSFPDEISVSASACCRSCYRSSLSKSGEELFFSIGGLCPDVVDYIFTEIRSTHQEVSQGVWYDADKNLIFCAYNGANDFAEIKAIKEAGKSFFDQCISACEDSGMPSRPMERMSYVIKKDEFLGCTNLKVLQEKANMMMLESKIDNKSII